MRTTLKRGVGRGHSENGNGTMQLPPDALGPIAIYHQPEPPRRTRRSLALTILGWAAVVVAVSASGVAGGAYLYLHQSVAAVAPRSQDVKVTARRLDLPVAGQPATALVIGYDRRASEGKNAPSRSDTLMLLRANPKSETISLLSFPRDLRTELVCPGRSSFSGKINAAYAYCGAKGTLETVRTLTGVPINYLITVNFTGFRQVVDKLGGIWMDVDRRYLNTHSGPGGYATINLQPGYQRLGGYQALDFVRFRHTDSDLYRNARQQLFVRSLKDQIRAGFSLRKLPQVVSVLTKNIEVGQGGGHDVSARTVLAYAVLAYSLPPGHVFQSRIDGLGGYSDLTTSSENISSAVREWANPDVESPKKATAVALGEKVKVKTPPAGETSVTILNGNGVAGSASNASYLLGQRGYAILTPPNGIPANAPNFSFFRTTVYFDATRKGAREAARKVAALFGSADVAKSSPAITALGNGAMLTTVVGQTFHGTLAAASVDQTPKRKEANVVPGTSAAIDLLRERQGKVNFPLMVPTVIEHSSWIDRERPIRLYWFDAKDPKHKTVRLTYKMGSNDYWGVQQSDWNDAAVLGSRNFVRNIGGRRYELFYSGPRLHMVVLRQGRASYWVVNTLLDKLPNETMLAIAKGLRPISKVRVS
ncbi:MAG: LytR family transcriptional regulator [Thermoleophilia bacterium]|nr:LytR family transcriptional regulator [Thermoleophilia bacterium]